jgi:thiol-disulfide isomerase/thioredoxin/sugar lactone lactonase YvrE
MSVQRATGLSSVVVLLLIGVVAGCLLLGGSESPVNPLQKRTDAPDFPPGMEWLNSRPLSKKDLKGKFVLLDFWTYCCINCMHILPELKKLEQKYPDELVVVGVHSAKFEGERQTENIREAILRYEIAHPVINDAQHVLWDGFKVDTWPTIVLIDPEGKIAWRRSGEFKAEEVEAKIKLSLPGFKKKGLLNVEPIKFDLEANRAEDTPLRFPGKLLADEKSGRLFIADSNHSRIVVAALDGKLLDVVGSGAIGKADGDYQKATFNHPQGLALWDDVLYVADNENHMIRKVDLKAKKVVTVAGTGEQNPGPKSSWSRGKPKQVALSSPWDLWIHDDDLYIAMAGIHQIWRMKLDESSIGPFAGSAAEDIIDGGLLPNVPSHRDGYAAFAQPSGLTSDGMLLYVADSEGSSIRAVTIMGRTKEVTTVVGTSKLPQNRLFTFGDNDGPKPNVLLQHCLGVAYHQGQIYVADTYNNKIKVVDAKTGATRTLAGTGRNRLSDNPATFDEPGGLSVAGNKLYVADTDNHAIREIDLESKRVSTITIEGLKPPEKPAATEKNERPDFTGAAEVKLKSVSVKPVDGKITLNVDISLPEGWKVNPQGKPSYWIDSPAAKGAVDRSAFGRRKLDMPAAAWEIELPTAKGSDTLRISTSYYYCQTKDEGVCKVGAVVFTVPIKVIDSADERVVQLQYEAQE